MKNSENSMTGILPNADLDKSNTNTVVSKEPDSKTSWMSWVRRMFGLGRNGTLRENLENELQRDIGDNNADFSPEERTLISNILKFREVRVDDVMVPRADIDAVEQDVTLGELIDMFKDSGHSRMPVFSNNLDDPKGMVHIKDVMDYICERSTKNSSNGSQKTALGTYELGKVDLSESIPKSRLVRPVLFVPPSMQATDLMAKMQTSRTQMALVIDEYGGTDGLVSLEDIVEIVFGDIEDEHDDDVDPMITSMQENIWLADARVDIEDARKVLGEKFCAEEQWEEIETLGGLLFTLAGRIPVRGEMITSSQLPGFEFEVIDADQRRIKRMRIYRRRIDPRTIEARRNRRKAGEERQQV